MTDWTIAIDTSSSVAPFEQLRAGIVEAVRSGELAVGTRLPTVRAFAETLGLAPNTVAKAYRELERDEVIETRGRAGSFVAATGDAPHRLAQQAALAYADRVAQLGVPAEEALAIVGEALRAR